MTFTSQKNFSDLIGKLVDVLEDRLRRRLSQSAPKPLGMATGRTMEPIYEKCKEYYNILWNKRIGKN